jgi:hypothetical protein
MLTRLLSKRQLFEHVNQNRTLATRVRTACPCSYSLGPTGIMTLDSHIFPARLSRVSIYLPVRHHESERLG